MLRTPSANRAFPVVKAPIAAKPQLRAAPLRAAAAPVARAPAQTGLVGWFKRAVLSKLPLAESPEDHRRVLAVLTYLESR